jgi:hypothetical protein
MIKNKISMCINLLRFPKASPNSVYKLEARTGRPESQTKYFAHQYGATDQIFYFLWYKFVGIISFFHKS